MAERQPPLPAGFQRPGVPGAGNILDPAVRGTLREKVHEAVHGVPGQVAPVQPEAPAPDAAEVVAEGTPAQGDERQPPHYRAGSFPHGDVDLRGFAANVPSEPVRPQRGGKARRFYFLPTSTQNEVLAPPIQPRDGPRPG